MKKMRKFAWIFMAAMTVAGFSACSNTEDEPLPGMGGNGSNGGNGGVTPPAPTVVLTDTLYDFQDAAGNYVAINDLCEGWTHEIVSPTDDNRTWQTKVYNEEKYIQATAHDSSEKNDGKQYDLWMFTPALDVKNAPEKVFSFYSEGAYWMESSKLEVYVTKAPQSTAEKTLLNPTLATSTAPGGNFKGWVASGDIDLSTYGDTVYVAFRYVAEGGKSKSTTYCIDNVAFGRKQVAMGGGTVEPDPDQPDTPDTPEVTDDTKAQFNTFNGGEAKSSYSTYTNAAGWTAENCAILAGDSTKDSNPYFKFITDGMFAPTLNGKVGAAGKLTSPVLNGGIGTLTFNYGFAFSDTQFKLTIQVLKDGAVVKEDVLEKTGLTKQTVYDYSLDVNVAGDFQIVIENNSLSQATGNKDRVSIWNLDWTEYAE